MTPEDEADEGVKLKLEDKNPDGIHYRMTGDCFRHIPFEYDDGKSKRKGDEAEAEIWGALNVANLGTILMMPCNAEHAAIVISAIKSLIHKREREAWAAARE
jgi:hypothetical protein